MNDADAIRSQAAAIATTKKPSKKQAHQFTEQLVQAVEHGESFEEHSHAIAALYAYFMPALPKKPKTSHGWVSKAAAKKDAREYLRFVHSDGDDLVATNGYRLHVLYGEGVAPGFYAPGDELTPDNVSYTYPDWRRAAPSASSLNEGIMADGWQDWPMYDTGSYGIAIKVGESTWVNRDYLADALYGFERPMTRLTSDANGPAVVMEADETPYAPSRQAVIMPMRI